MGKVENAVKFAENIAADNSHGYDQLNRWGPDYDCSSLVITAYQNAGVPVKDKGATYTGNMYNAFKSVGFKDITSSVTLSTGAGLKRGDVLLNKVHHTAMCTGSGKIVEASINEKGTIMGGKTGDQTGKEIHTRSYYSYPWDCVLRYPETGSCTTYYVKSDVNYRVGPGVNFTKKGEYKTGTAVKVENNSDTKVGADTWVLTADGYWCCKEYLTKTAPASSKTLDTKGFKRGEQSDGIFALKSMLDISRQLGLVSKAVDANGIFGEGTENAVNELLKKWGYEPNSIAGGNFVDRLRKEILKKL